MSTEQIKHKRILHLGWGFRPWRGGGLIQYAEDLMEIQKSKGHDVFYFFAGRHYPIFNKPKIIKWKKNGINMFEIINSPIIHSGDRGTLSPQQDIKEIISEDFFRNVIQETLPDIIHIHELAGLPSSLIEIAKDEYQLPIVMTLADYFLLCPTLKLFDYLNENCEVFDVSQKCLKCCMNSPTENTSLIHRSLQFEIENFKTIRAVKLFLHSISRVYNIYQNIIKQIMNRNYKKIMGNLYLISTQFQYRRITNLKRLKKIDLLIARSKSTENTYKYYLGQNTNIITINPTVKHLRGIKPKKYVDLDYPIKFATFNGFASVPKGAIVLFNAITSLQDKEIVNLFELHIYGTILKDMQIKIKDYKNVYYHGMYTNKNLAEILDKIHVGIIPSVWEEVFGYVGLEFLAKGIPVIGNNRGGITEYTKNGITGFLNKSATANELADIMTCIINNPIQLIKLNNSILENYDKIIKSIEFHFYEMERVYNMYVD